MNRKQNRTLVRSNLWKIFLSIAILYFSGCKEPATTANKTTTNPLPAGEKTSTASSTSTDTSSGTDSSSTTDTSTSSGINTSSNTDPDTSALGTLAISVNPLAAAYPQGLAISAFSSTPATNFDPGTLAINTELRDSSLRLASEEEEVPVKDSYAGQYELEQKRLRGLVDNCFDADPLKRIIEFGGGGDGCFTPAQGGLYTPTSTAPNSTEACMAAYGRNTVKGLGISVSSFLGLQQSIYCELLKRSLDTALPAVGNERDFTDFFNPDSTWRNRSIRKSNGKTLSTKLAHDESNARRFSRARKR